MPRVTSTNKLFGRCFKALIPALSRGRSSRGLERRRRDAEITLAPVTHDGASELKPAFAVYVSLRRQIGTFFLLSQKLVFCNSDLDKSTTAPSFVRWQTWKFSPEPFRRASYRRVSHRRVSRGRTPHGLHLKGVHLIGIHFTGVHFIGVHLIGMCLMGVHLTSVSLIGVHLTGVYVMSIYLMGVYLTVVLTGEPRARARWVGPGLSI
jgi:hypothetical protein